MASRGLGNRGRRSGWRLRRMSTAMETRMKANRVPMFERSASVPMSNIPAGMATKKSGDPGGHIRRAKFVMDAGKERRKKAVARHGEPDARLAELENKDRRNHAQQRAGGDPAIHAIEADGLKRLGYGRRGAERAPVLGCPSEQSLRQCKETRRRKAKRVCQWGDHVWEICIPRRQWRRSRIRYR